MIYSIQEIATVINVDPVPLHDAKIRIWLTDSRTLSEPSVSLFFALSTSNNDGHRYIADLYEKGVRNFVVQSNAAIEILPKANYLRVDDTLMALQQLAAFHRQQFAIPILGITGSNGKTIVKEWLYQLLYDQFQIVRSPRSYNSQIGVPLSVSQLNENTELGIFEAGISLCQEMIRLEPIIRPTIGIFTNLGDAHQENFSSQEEKCLEKLTLFDNVQTIIYNEDNSLIANCVRMKGFQEKAFTWSRINPNVPVFISKIEKLENQTSFEAIVKKVSYSFVIPFVDEASIENVIHCLTYIFFSCSNPEEILPRFSSLEPVAMRMNVINGIHDNTLINDTYNSDINSLSIALDFMSSRSMDKQKKRVLILSDILQPGMCPDDFYQRVSELVVQKEVQQIIGIGSQLMQHASLFSIEKEFYRSTEDYLLSGKFRELNHSIVLLKGSREFRFERIVEKLEEKAHQTVLEVDLEAVVHNLKYFRSYLKSTTKVICMVKAFGYGIGSYELAKTLQERGADYLAVAVADEGAELRREGITMPIMVMNPEEHAFNTLFEYGLEPEIYNLNLLNAIVREAEQRGVFEYPVHIKLDTGMSRLGFDKSDIPLIANVINKQSGVLVKSVFSHLAGSDSELLDDYTHAQIALFRKESAELGHLLAYPFARHLLNSAGIERFPEAQLDMVRLGIGLYGISVLDDENVQSVASLKTKVLQIRNVKAENTVGYNRKGKLFRDSRIACIPIGYADGLDRRLGNGNGKVWVNGQLCPFVGNICMDISMIDVTDVLVKEGDEVQIFGDKITIQELADKLDTIPYECLTRISPRVKRVYFSER